MQRRRDSDNAETEKEKSGAEPGNCSRRVQSKASSCNRADACRGTGNTGYAGRKETSCKKGGAPGRSTGGGHLPGCHFVVVTGCRSHGSERSLARVSISS